MNIEDSAYKQLQDLYNTVKSSLKHPMEFYPVNIELILRQNGWVIHEVDGLGIFKDGQIPIGKSDLASKEISINVNMAESRKRFTLAHELGHIVLHGHLCNTHYRHSNSKRPAMADHTTQIMTQKTRHEELEAQRFAASILMPSKAVQAHFFTLFNRNSIRLASTPNKSIEEELKEICTFEDNENKSLSDFFEVSLQAMIIRLKNLRLVICT